jgi:hypothetical protein
VPRRSVERLVEFMVDEMVAGKFKFYRQAAAEKIGGFVRGLMWERHRPDVRAARRGA